MPLNIDEMGSPGIALDIIMKKARTAIFCNLPSPYALTVRIYNAGYQSLHQSYPTLGFYWMVEPRNSEQARKYCWKAVQQAYKDIRLNLVIDCTEIQTQSAELPGGHLGFHRQALASFLAHEGNKMWRVRQYTKIWLLLQTKEMVPKSREAHFLTFCRKGKQRSVMFSVLCARIFNVLGFNVIYKNTCMWVQMKSVCQRNAGCEFCGMVREGIYSWQCDENVVHLQELAVAEFFEVDCALEACATRTHYAGMWD